jgi:uncharacterized protein (TIGR03067 family)
MKMILMLSATLAFLSGADNTADANKEDQAAMQGDWALATMISDGQTIPDDDCQGLFRTMKDDHYSVFRYDKVIAKGTFFLDATQKPRTIDFRPANAAPGAKPMLGIYKIEDGKLKICYARPGMDRPKQFSSTEGSKHTISVWQREKQ